MCGGGGQQRRSPSRSPKLALDLRCDSFDGLLLRLLSARRPAGVSDLMECTRDPSSRKHSAKTLLSTALPPRQEPLRGSVPMKFYGYLFET